MRNSVHWFFIALLFALYPTGASVQAQQPAALVIEGGTLIDGSGGAPVRDAVVVIQGNKIATVSRKGQVTYPAGAQVIKADGKFILPGLWDAQVSYQSYYGDAMLHNGITSTIDVGNAGPVAAIVRDAVMNGKLVAPRTFTGITRLSSVLEGRYDTGLEPVLAPTRAPKTVEEVRALVRALVEAKADIIMFQDGSMPMELYRAGFDEAKKAGKPVFTRAYGPIFGPKEAAQLGSRNLPHSAGIGAAITRNPPAGRNDAVELDLYAEMDEAKARELIQILVQNKTALTPTFKMQYPGYPRDWARFEEEDRTSLNDPNLLAYYPLHRVLTAMASYSRHDRGAVRERRMKGWQNALRFHKMFADAGGHLVPGANTNVTKTPMNNLHHEMQILAEAGVSPMTIIQGATKWSAEMIDKQNILGTVEAGKLADVIIVNADPLQSINNLQKIDAVIQNGKVLDRGYHPWYRDPFRLDSDWNEPVEYLKWVAAFRRVTFGEGPGEGEVRPGAGALRDPVESPQPAIESISPLIVTEGTTAVTVTIKGFNFVRRSQILFKGVSVPYRVVSPTELQVTIEGSLLREPGFFDLVVKNPWPINREMEIWGNGTSNKAHLVVNFRY